MKKLAHPIVAFALVLVTLVGSVPLPAQAVSPDIVISQVYGGGGNVGATYTHDFIELYNRGTATVSLSGWSLQYASATGTGNFGSSTTQITPLSGSLEPGQYLLIQEAQGSGGTAPLPTPDVTDSSPIAMSATGAKVALVNSTTGLGCNGGSTPCSAAQLALIKDLVGWDGADFYETIPAPTTSNSTAILRVDGGCTDNDNNAADFTVAAPAPRNTASTLHDCTSPTNPTGAGVATPNAPFAFDSTLLTVFAYPGSNPTSTGIVVTCDLSSIGGSATQAFFDDGTNGDVTPDDSIYSFLATVPGTTTPGSKTLPVTITDAENRTGSASISLTVRPPLVAIHDIQGASHISPKSGVLVSTQGIVTAKRSNGFYMQDNNPDADDSTAEAIFVFTSSAPAAKVGDMVLATGTVKEFRSGGASSTNLTTTELDNPGRTVTVLSSGNPLPAPVVVGTGGRIPPSMVIEDDATGDVETSGVFDPANDGLDFYESLEGMLVQVNDAVAVGPWRNFGSNREIPVVGDNGANASLRTNRGGVVIRSTDYNPERIILNDLIAGGPTLPTVNVSDSFPGAIVGAMDYSFGNYKLEVISMPTVVSGGLAQEIAAVSPAYQLAIGTFNVENLAPTDPSSKFSTLANLIVQNLRTPDILAIEEIQDNNGVTDNGVVDASITWGKLIAAIQSAGGPTYGYRQIDPVNDEDGGATGGNIRQGFLFRTDRGLSFVDRPGADSTASNAVVGSGATTQLLYSPGRIDPTNIAFFDSRKPLAGEFTFKGDKVFVVANHFNSKSGDQPLFGHFQPPVFSSEVQRMLQAKVVNGFVGDILAADANANVVVLGDLNDFQFSMPVTTLKGSVLQDLIETLPEGERYSYVYDGNSEVLDHILTSNSTFGRPLGYDVVHVNSEFANQASDHEPQVANLCVDRTQPALNVTVSPNVLWPPNHKYRLVKATVTVSDNADLAPAWKLVSVTSNEPDNGLDDGDTPNDIVIVDNTTFELRAERSGTGTGRVYTITYQATDACGNITMSSVTVTVPFDLTK